MDWIILLIALVITLTIVYMIGHWVGYGKGEQDTIDRARDYGKRED